jgi:uncharacterized protein YfaT (DUF1175 family)
VAWAGSSPHLRSPADRAAFCRWFTFLAESRAFAHKRLPGVSDNNGLLAWAYREALTEHTPHWYRSLELPVVPAMPSVQDPAGLQPEPARILVSRRIEDARPGDLLLFRPSGNVPPLMIFIGASQVLPSPKQWVVYLENAKHAQKISIDTLCGALSPQCRPLPDNPDFLGVWRLELLAEP